jgi:hypothetical protein
MSVALSADSEEDAVVGEDGDLVAVDPRAKPVTSVVP